MSLDTYYTLGRSGLRVSRLSRQISLEKHIEQFGKAPTLASADRGVYSQPNETIATQKGVKRVILPKSGYKSKQR